MQCFVRLASAPMEAVAIIAEDRPPPVGPAGDMIRTTRLLKTQMPRHDKSL
jgi:hypothetical protein